MISLAFVVLLSQVVAITALDAVQVNFRPDANGFFVEAESGVPADWTLGANVHLQDDGPALAATLHNEMFGVNPVGDVNVRPDENGFFVEAKSGVPVLWILAANAHLQEDGPAVAATFLNPMLGDNPVTIDLDKKHVQVGNVAITADV